MSIPPCQHKALDLGLDVRPDGYIPLAQVLASPLLSNAKSTVEEVERIVKENDKQRFALAVIAGVPMIRAHQGHSMKVVQDELCLETLTLRSDDLPVEVVHGTYMRFWEPISRQGLRAGGKHGAGFRNHVHFAKGLPKDGGIWGLGRICNGSFGH